METTQHVVTALLTLAVAVLTGATVSQWWLGSDTSGWAEARRRPVRGAALTAAVIALAANVAWLWLESAAMAEVPVTAAADATWSMLTATHLGVAFRFGFAGLVAAATGAIAQQGRSVACMTLTVAGLAMFWYTRSMVSHAASDGDFSVRLLADWVHLCLISFWVGEVILSAGIMWRATGVVTAADRRARAVYVTSLSASATFALAGILATGIYAAWRTLGGLAHLIGNPYGNILLAKLLLVGVAALLGGFNRFVVMPLWLAREATGDVAPAAVPIRFKRVLTTEAFVLTAIVVVAAWLASTSPPGEQM